MAPRLRTFSTNVLYDTTGQSRSMKQDAAERRGARTRLLAMAQSAITRIWRPSLHSEKAHPLRTTEKTYSHLRVKVMRRDRYRCRVCDRRGDEITLSAHCIDSIGLSKDRMLTLCETCRKTASDRKLVDISVAEFLRSLWTTRC
jgi:hypothetical protein